MKATHLQKDKQLIIWAMDPTQNPSDSKSLIKELKIWSQRLNLEVLPVSIISKSILGIPTDLTFPWDKNFEKVVHKSVKRFLKKAHADNFLPPELVYVKTVSHRKMAARLAEYAKEKNARLVAVNTRARKTWNPLRLGGFAETLVATSTVPVLLLNPDAVPSKQIQKILFPTDFTRESRNALSRVKPLAKAFNSELLIYNQVESLYMPSDFDGIGVATYNLANIEKDIEQWRTKKMRNLGRQLEHENIRCTTLVERQRNHLSAEILKVARNKEVDLIALYSHGGPVAQALLGSVPRDILLQAKCPVLIFHKPKAVRIHAQSEAHLPMIRRPEVRYV